MPDRRRADVAVLLLLAVTAGAVDLWSVTSLGGAYAGVVTGNLVSVGHGIGTADLASLLAPAVAVACFALGVVVWSFAWRRDRAAVGAPLAAELVVLVALAVAWALPAVPTLVLLGAAALAMGAQSAVAVRLGESTTYMTGTLTGALVGLVTGAGRGRVWALRQVAAVLVGATLAAVLLAHVPWAVPVLAAVTCAAAGALRARA